MDRCSNNSSSGTQGSSPKGRRELLEKIYLQVEGSIEPRDILGITDLTFDNIRSAYKALALQVHSDKSLPHEYSRHSKLFIKVKDAYDVLLKYIESTAKAKLTALDEPTLEELQDQADKDLHQRNCDFRQALREARDEAIAAKHSRNGTTDWQRTLLSGNPGCVSYAEKEYREELGGRELRAEIECDCIVMKKIARLSQARGGVKVPDAEIKAIERKVRAKSYKSGALPNPKELNDPDKWILGWSGKGSDVSPKRPTKRDRKGCFPVQSAPKPALPKTSVLIVVKKGDWVKWYP